MDYQEAIAFLDSLVNYERRPNVDFIRREVTLKRVQELASLLGNPQETLKCVHIAGTKGKGSTAAMTEAVLRAHGLTTGLYTSPHLVNARERVRLNGRMISRDLFASLIERLKPHIEKRRKDDERRATYFETFTHLGFMAFNHAAVDVAVVEVGMGGRLDATNIIRPLVCGITAIGIDHVQQLGSDVVSIAREKAGIIKEGIPVAAAPRERAAEEVIRSIAEERGAPLLLMGRDFGTKAEGEGSFTVSLAFADMTFKDLRLSLVGGHQRANAALALALAAVFSDKISLALDEDKIRSALKTVSWPGRIQKVNQDPPIYVDGAHNRQSLEVLLTTIRETHPGKPLFVAFGCGIDKDIEGMLAALGAGEYTVAFTRSTSPRAALLEELAERFGNGEMLPGVTQALEWLRRKAGENAGVGILTGSLYIAGEALSLLGLVEPDD